MTHHLYENLYQGPVWRALFGVSEKRLKSELISNTYISGDCGPVWGCAFCENWTTIILIRLLHYSIHYSASFEVISRYRLSCFSECLPWWWGRVQQYVHKDSWKIVPCWDFEVYLVSGKMPKNKVKSKRIKAVSQKRKLFRAKEPLISVFMWGINSTVRFGRSFAKCTLCNRWLFLLMPFVLTD